MNLRWVRRNPSTDLQTRLGTQFARSRQRRLSRTASRSDHKQDLGLHMARSLPHKWNPSRRMGQRFRLPIAIQQQGSALSPDFSRTGSETGNRRRHEM